MMNSEYLADIAAACLRVKGESVSHYERREMARIIARREAHQQRNADRDDLATFAWKKPAPRR